MDFKRVVNAYLDGYMDIQELKRYLNFREENDIEVERAIKNWNGEEDFLRYWRRTLKNIQRKKIYQNNQRLVDNYLEEYFNFEVNKREDLLEECDKFLVFANSQEISVYNASIRAYRKSLKFRELVKKYFIEDMEWFREVALGSYRLGEFGDVILRVQNLEKYIRGQNEELVKRYQSGEENLLEDIILNNKGLVDFCVIKFLRAKTYQSLTKEDLEQEGIVALIKAVRNYDEAMENSFSVYAYKAITNGIIRAIYNYDRMVRLPVDMEEKMDIIYKEKKQSEEMGKKVNIKSLMARIGGDVEKYQWAWYFRERLQSLDTLVEIDGEMEALVSTVAGDTDVCLELERQETKEEVEDLLLSLTSRQFRVISLYYGFDNRGGYGKREIANMLGTSDANIYCYMKLAHEKLKKILDKKYSR